ncbi:MAG: sugar ABC transporter permease [Chloroflexi bacterium]|nr:MAG: sugar ABC transporter permease [Chloroflexota bacterium]MBL1193775.1 sugar ABC transporter permease [Chloroflexota bacterium]NOH11068.1 sugar ABC transporter permease [Chloroflexota bacterium]
MAQLDQAPGSGSGFNPLEWLGSQLGRLVVSVLVPGVLFVVLWQGFIFLRDSEAPQYLIAIIAIVWGVGGAAALYFVSNWIIERLGPEWTRRLQPFVFVGPAMAILAWYLAIPTLRTLWLSFFDRTSDNFIFLDNYIDIFTDPNLIVVFRNNLLWIVFGASLSVILGLLIAVLADRSRYESLAKSLIFLPMAISFVGAGVIWNFIYEVKDISAPQIGLLNAIWVGLGGEPQAWTALLQPWNNLFLIIIVVWLQTGYAMVLFSAAIKGIPGDLIEAARVDGATEVQIFFRIMIPYIWGTIITVATTIVIFTLKIFDIVLVMTGGRFGTEVIATAFYRQNFTNRNFGLGSAIAIVLLLLVVPVMIYNLRKFGEEEAFE